MKKAIMIGGPNDGQIWELDKAYPEIEIAHRVMERNGEWRVLSKVRYKFKYHGGARLEYEYSDSN